MRPQLGERLARGAGLAHGGAEAGGGRRAVALDLVEEGHRRERLHLEARLVGRPRAGEGGLRRAPGVGRPACQQQGTREHHLGERPQAGLDVGLGREANAVLRRAQCVVDGIHLDEPAGQLGARPHPAGEVVLRVAQRHGATGELDRARRLTRQPGGTRGLLGDPSLAQPVGGAGARAARGRHRRPGRQGALEVAQGLARGR